MTMRQSSSNHRPFQFRLKTLMRWAVVPCVYLSVERVAEYRIAFVVAAWLAAVILVGIQWGAEPGLRLAALATIVALISVILCLCCGGHHLLDWFVEPMAPGL